MAGGLSAVVALPVLEAMLDQHGEALAGGAGRTVRFMTWFWGNGFGMDDSRWTPSGTGPDYSLNTDMAPLTNVRDQLTVLTGFNSHVDPITKITHHEGMSIFSGYNNADIGQGEGFFSNAGGPTIDQLIADVVGEATPIRSVQVGVSKRPSTVDFGTTMHNLSHRGYLQPLPAEWYPRAMWTSVFGSFTPPDDAHRPLRLSVLDLVRDQTTKLKQRLGQADIIRLDAHLDGVSLLEKKISTLPPACERPTEPTSAQNNVDIDGDEPLAQVGDLMSDLLVYAFKCDITRVASYLLGEGAGEYTFRDDGVSQSSQHHLLTHDIGAVDEVAQGVQHAMRRLAYLLERCAAEEDMPGQTLLDNMILFASSDCSTGWDHSVDNQPMLIAGGGGGALVPGMHYASGSGQNPSDVLLALLRVFDPSATSVGADDPMSTTPFNDILL
jgi:hypothetical protein